MIYTEIGVIDVYEQSLDDARERLSLLGVAEGRTPTSRLISGWVFEQTVRFCLTQELSAVNIRPLVQEQVKLCGRAKIDLLVGNVAIELKALGSFGKRGFDKYEMYRLAVESHGWVYLYLTKQERHAPFRQSAIDAFGSNGAFFLNIDGDWKRFADAVIKYLSESN